MDEILDKNGAVIIAAEEMRLTHAYFEISATPVAGMPVSNLAIVEAYNVLSEHLQLWALANEARIINQILQQDKSQQTEKLSEKLTSDLKKRLDNLDEEAYGYVSQFTTQLETKTLQS